MMENVNSSSTPRRKFGRWRLAALLGVPALAVLLWLKNGNSSNSDGATFAARRGPLDITVLEGGSIQAIDSQEVKCEVRVGYQGLRILKIVEEGYQVTEDDIRTNKVLVELDSSDLQKQILQQDIQYEQAAASLTDAQQNYEIQLNQNLSDIKAAEQKARFARMDFDKFLGDTVTQEIIDQLGMEKELAIAQTNASERSSAVMASVPSASVPKEPEAGPGMLSTTNAPANRNASVASAVVLEIPPLTVRMADSPLSTPAPTVSTYEMLAADALPAAPVVVIDFTKYAKLEVLGDGEAKQKLRKFEDDLQVARKEEGQAKATLAGTQRLFEKGFVTKIDLERDDIAAENNRLKVQTAVTARDLFLKYEFSKTAEEFLSKYAEAARELVRARKAAVSKLAQAQAKLKAAQGQFNIQARARKDMYEQLQKCTITAQKPGLVVYGGGREGMYYGGEERVREGASVRERQPIITIPDMTKMSVRVKIHESYIKKVKKGQKARVTVDAFPDQTLDGEVTNVGVLPDSQNMWMNPDMKVYLTTITIHGTQDWLKPGMSAKVEIIVNRLADVVYVPVQAVSPFEGKQACYVANGGSPDRHVVEIGEFNDEFIEIKKGLKEGERVLLRRVVSSTPEGSEEPKEKPSAPKPPTAPTAPPAGPSAVSAQKG